MEIADLKQLIAPYSPWMSPETRPAWEKQIPDFKRPVFYRLIEDIAAIDQIISITGPRRVGKSTLLQQIVRHLLDEEKVDPSHIFYYSLDDPALFRPGVHGGEFLESLIEHVAKKGKPVYLFLDEIQTLERWEQYLKKYYDLKYPVRVVVSGSASSPIFKKSRESLLGRVKDYHVLPFSFREFLMYRLHAKNNTLLLNEVNAIHHSGKALREVLVRSPDHLDKSSPMTSLMTDELWTVAQAALDDFMIDGGFPEVWKLPTEEMKIEYLFDNQVKKVIYEDLVLATELRKPEQLKQFYISLLERPGQEVSIASLSNEIGIGTQQIDKYLPLLEMTDLLAHASKFRSSAISVRKGNRKFYLVDLALRNAVLRIGREILESPDMMGLYAENLVFNALRKWEGILQIDYYREKQKEVDFIVHVRPSKFWPVEVKFRNKWNNDLQGVTEFSSKHRCLVPTIVTKNKEDWGWVLEKNLFCVPLIPFLLMFD